MPKVDVVIIEGLKHSDYPKIVVQRRGISDAAKERYTNVLCRVCDFTMESGENTTPVFDFTELPAIYACVRNALFAGDFGETGQAYD
jgi:molybdopterin-guanine dinucleotide biosynthesis protein